MSESRTHRQTAHRSGHGSVIQGALENIAVEMGYKLMRMSYSTHHPRVGGLRRGAHRRTGPAALRVQHESRRCSRGRSPATCAASCSSSQARGDDVAPGDVIMHNDPYGGASTGPTSASAVPVFLRRPAGRLLGHDRPPSRHRRADARQLRHRRRGRRLCRGTQFKAIKVYEAGPAERRGLAACCATTSAPRTWWSATWRRRSAAAGSVPSAISSWSSVRPRDRQRRLRGPAGLFRAPDARAIARLPDGVYTAHDLYRRLSRRPGPGAKDLPIAVDDHGRGRRASPST